MQESILQYISLTNKRTRYAKNLKEISLVWQRQYNNVGLILRINCELDTVLHVIVNHRSTEIFLNPGR